MSTTVGDPPAEREPDHVTPDVRHFADIADAYTMCGLERAKVRWTDDLDTPVDCPHCATVIGRTPAEPQPAEPERRTVSLEVLTDELRDVPMDYEPETGATNYVPAEARVGVIFRIADRPVQVTDVDSEWRRDKRARSTAAIFGLMLLRAAYVADDHEAELLMPTPDVLAALDGRPDATFWTGEIDLRADQVADGWLVEDFRKEGVAELVTEVDECADKTCPWHGSCTVITAGEPVHFPDWSDLTVRIPASVIR